MPTWSTLSILLAISSLGTGERICLSVCDGDASGKLSNPRKLSTVSYQKTKELALFISDEENAGFGRLINGTPNDEIWMDRSWNGGQSYEEGSRLGHAIIPQNSNQVDTTVVNKDGNDRVGAIRACANPNNTNHIVCTGWISRQNCEDVCDGDSSDKLPDARKVHTSTVNNREFAVFVSDIHNAAFGRVSNGAHGDEVWLDRSYDGGSGWNAGSRLGIVLIPSGETQVTTTLVNIDGNVKAGEIGLVRACGFGGGSITCTGWAAKRICHKVCDEDKFDRLRDPINVISSEIFWRQVSVFVSDLDNAAFAQIANGDSTDEIWLDRSWDGGKTWEGRLGYSRIPDKSRLVNTPTFNYDGNHANRKDGVIRACGKAGNRDEITCTGWTKASTREKIQVCNSVCDGDVSTKLRSPYKITFTNVHGREISVFVSDNDNAAYAQISNGDPDDEVWIDRSWNGGRSWLEGERLGFSKTPPGSREVRTTSFNIDGKFKDRRIGILRACGKAGNRDDIACTSWTRARTHAANPAKSAATALMLDYDARGLWDKSGWPTSANCLMSILDYMKVTGDRTFMYAINHTYEFNKNKYEGTFCNEYMDDSGWWALTWIRAYDLTRNVEYFETAKTIADYMFSFADNTCGGGVWWSTSKSYKSAITTEIFIKLAASIYNRSPKERKHLDRATDTLLWFENSGMLNSKNLVNDGLAQNCLNTDGLITTSNQGVIIGAYVELYKATDDRSYLEKAQKIADSVVGSSELSPDGILHEPCDRDGNDCGADKPSFKGIFARNLGELNEALDKKPYSDYIRCNAEKIALGGNSVQQYGLHYEGPFEFYSAASQQSALDMFTAARRNLYRRYK